MHKYFFLILLFSTSRKLSLFLREALFQGVWKLNCLKLETLFTILKVDKNLSQKRVSKTLQKDCFDAQNYCVVLNRHSGYQYKLLLRVCFDIKPTLQNVLLLWLQTYCANLQTLKALKTTVPTNKMHINLTEPQPYSTRPLKSYCFLLTIQI